MATAQSESDEQRTRRWADGPARPRRGVRGLWLSVAGGRGDGPVGLLAAAAPAGAEAKTTNVNVVLTPQGCAPKPAKVATGQIQFNVSNKNAGAVSEAELRTGNLSHILGEQENLTPGLSGGFALVVQPGRYVINCPGASRQHATFTVTGKSKAANWKTKSVLSSRRLRLCDLRESAGGCAGVFHPGPVCGDQRREPDAGRAALPGRPASPTNGSSRWPRSGAPSTPRSTDGSTTRSPTRPIWQGFHKLEMLMWADDTLTGAAPVLRPAGVERAASSEADRNRLVRSGDHGERRDRPHQRGGHVQDHRRGRALLQHRLHRVPGQRRWGDGGLHLVEAVPPAGRPLARQGCPEVRARGRERHRPVQGDARATTTPATSSTRPCSILSGGRFRPRSRRSPSSCPRCRARCHEMRVDDAPPGRRAKGYETAPAFTARPSRLDGTGFDSRTGAAPSGTLSPGDSCSAAWASPGPGWRSGAASPRRRTRSLGGGARGGGHRAWCRAARTPSMDGNQAGIVTPAQDRLAFASMNVIEGVERSDAPHPAQGLDGGGRAHEPGPARGRRQRPERPTTRHGRGHRFAGVGTHHHHRVRPLPLRREVWPGPEEAGAARRPPVPAQRESRSRSCRRRPLHPGLF